MALANRQGPPARAFIIERWRQGPGRPLVLWYDEAQKRLTLTEDIRPSDDTQRFQVDTDGYIQNIAAGENGFLTRSAMIIGPVTFSAKDTSPDSPQRWNFKAGPERSGVGPPDLPVPGSQADVEMQKFTLVVTPDAGQTNILQAPGVGGTVVVVPRTTSPESAPEEQSWNFRRVGVI